MLNILCIGDVTSPGGVDHLQNTLWDVRKKERIDLCVVNAENAALITGASPELADTLFTSGADVLTGGNHTLRNRASWQMLDECDAMLRPANFPPEAPGHGYTIANVSGYSALVISVMGTVGIEPTLDNPFTAVDRILAREAGNYDFAVLDFHAEATGEKVALGYAFDGKIAAIFGTHTHVPTADERILPRGTGYITDVGMCGESDGVLGMEPESVIFRMRTHLSEKFAPATGNPMADGVIFTVDPGSGRCTAVRRIRF